MKNKILRQDFFTRDGLLVAEELIGKLLVRRVQGREIKARIIETEAYLGEDDKACHAKHGKTQRNAPMFALGGRTYVYLCYGIHHLFNIVTGQEGQGEAVLIRKVLTEEGAELGPGSLTKYLQIGRNDSDQTLDKNGIFILDDGFKVGKVLKAKRVGIEYAKEYKDKLWRFILAK